MLGAGGLTETWLPSTSGVPDGYVLTTQDQKPVWDESSGSQAADISVDDTSFEVITGTNAQAAFDSIDDALLNARSTGVRFGGIGSIASAVTMDITAGAGEILDVTDPENPIYTSVSWSAITGQTLVNTGVSSTYWYIDSAGAIQQTTTAPSPSDFRTNIYLFRTSYTGGALSAVSNISIPIQQAVDSLHDLSVALGPIRVSGSVPTSSGANLKLKITSGEFYDLGVTRWTAPLAPNSPFPPTFDSGVASTFRYITTTGVIAVDETDIDVGFYQVAGVVTAIPGANTRVGIYYVLGFPSGSTRVTYANNYYTNFTEALAALGVTDPYTTTPGTVNRSNSFVLGAVLAVKNATDLSNAAQAQFVVTNRFGQFNGAAAVAGGGFITASSSDTLTNKDLTSGTNTFPTFNQNTTGSAATLTTGRTIAITGDLAYTSPSFNGSNNVTAAGTLATVNSNVGSFGSATQVGTFTVNGKGLITAASNTTVTPAIGSITGLGTGVATALAVNVGTAGSPVVNGGALGTPSSGVATNLTGTASGLTAGTVTTNANLTGAITSTGNATSLGSFTSANLRTALTDETGGGAAVFADTPTLIAPVLGVATATSVNFGQDPLNYYDEGVWTPTLIGSSTAGTQTYTNQIGRFTRIGRMVYCTCRVSITAKDGAIAGNVQIGGLPFPTANVASNQHTFSVGYGTGFTLAGSGYWLYGLVAPNVSVVTISNSNGNATANIAVGSMAAASEIRCQFFYEA